MSQPHFRQQITEYIQRLPAPIPQLWRPVDPLHHSIDAGINRMERFHNGFRDNVVLRVAARLHARPEALDSYRAIDSRVFGSIFGWLRTAHWYV